MLKDGIAGDPLTFKSFKLYDTTAVAGDVMVGPTLWWTCLMGLPSNRIILTGHTTRKQQHGAYHFSNPQCGDATRTNIVYRLS